MSRPVWFGDYHAGLRPPLPAGSCVSWGCITINGEAWPGPAPDGERANDEAADMSEGTQDDADPRSP